jgi:hypothetical protein
MEGLEIRVFIALVRADQVKLRPSRSLIDYSFAFPALKIVVRD